MDIILGLITGLSVSVSIALWIKLKQIKKLLEITREDRNSMLKKYLDSAGIAYSYTRTTHKEKRETNHE